MEQFGAMWGKSDYPWGDDWGKRHSFTPATLDDLGVEVVFPLRSVKRESNRVLNLLGNVSEYVTVIGSDQNTLSDECRIVGGSVNDKMEPLAAWRLSYDAEGADAAVMERLKANDCDTDKREPCTGFRCVVLLPEVLQL